MIVTFCGHAQLSQNSGVEKWLYAETEKLIEEGAASFYLGGYGDFDSLAASVLKSQKRQHSQIQRILVLAYTNRSPLAVLGGFTKMGSWLNFTTLRWIWMLRRFQLISDQRNPQASPRRIPVASTSLK